MKSVKRLTRKSAKSKPAAKPARKTARKKSGLGAPGPTAPGVPLIGQVGLFAFGFSAAGWLPCDGRLMSIMQNQALFSLLGTTYGGDARTSFGLPKLKPVDPQGPGYFIAVQGAYPMR
jgi:tail collar domain